MRSSKKNKSDKYYAALDLGTNSCRMLVVRTCGNTYEVCDSFSKSVQLGDDLEANGFIPSVSINKAMKALKVCKKKLDQYPIEMSKLVATEACRRAKNGQKFLKQVEKEVGLKLEIIEPDEEAKYAVIGCAPLMKKKYDNILVIDIGGGSTELVWLKFKEDCQDDRLDQLMKINLKEIQTPSRADRISGTQNNEGSVAEVIDWLSIPLGVSTLSQRYFDIEEDVVKFALMACEFEDHLSSFLPYNTEFYLSKDRKVQVIGTSGTITTIGAVHLGLEKYDREKVDGLELTSGQVENVIHKLFRMGSLGREKNPAIGVSRCNLIIPGLAIVQTVLRNWPGKQICIADRGLRDGILHTLIKENHGTVFESEKTK